MRGRAREEVMENMGNGSLMDSRYTRQRDRENGREMRHINIPCTETSVLLVPRPSHPGWYLHPQSPAGSQAFRMNWGSTTGFSGPPACRQQTVELPSIILWPLPHISFYLSILLLRGTLAHTITIYYFQKLYWML